MVEFKRFEDKEMLTGLHPLLLMIFFDLVAYAQMQHGVDLTVTATLSTKEEDILLGRKSSSHREARALDIRTLDLDAFVPRSCKLHKQ